MAAAAQPDAAFFLDTVDVNVVNIEVVVNDKYANPVTDLTRNDFMLLEDGQPVELSNFFAVAEGREAAEGEPADAPTRLPGPETQRLQLVVFVDELTIRLENRISVGVRHDLAQADATVTLEVQAGSGPKETALQR